MDHRVNFFVFSSDENGHVNTKNGARVSLVVEDDDRSTPPHVLGIRKLRSLCSTKDSEVQFLLMDTPVTDDDVKSEETSNGSAAEATAAA